MCSAACAAPMDTCTGKNRGKGQFMPPPFEICLHCKILKYRRPLYYITLNVQYFVEFFLDKYLIKEVQKMFPYGAFMSLSAIICPPNRMAIYALGFFLQPCN